MTHKDDHVVKPGRRPGSERCTVCSWTYPCREETCGHLDCMEFRGHLAQCHYCEKRVRGSPGSICSPSSTISELRQTAGDVATWTSWNVHGVLRAVHYTCRDSNASPAELFRWYGRGSLNRVHNESQKEAP